MTTAHDEDLTPVEDPELDLDAMLADLHADFPDPDTDASATSDAAGGEEDAGEEQPPPSDSSPAPDPVLDRALPPGMVEFGGEVMPLQEAQALLEINRQVKGDPAKARLVREALLGQQTKPAEPDLPEWMDPEDQQTVFLYKQQQRIDAELAEIKASEARRQQDFEVSQADQRKQQVITSFRSSLQAFHQAHPEFEQAEVAGIVDRAANMGLLEAPEKLDSSGSLEGGMSKALDLAMWDVPEYRDKALHSDTLRSKANQAETRKHKSSALSSSTGSTPRNNSQEARPTNRTEMMANALADFRSGLSD